VDSPQNPIAVNLECAVRNSVEQPNDTSMTTTEISREQLLKEAPQLVEYAILRGWMSRPKKIKSLDAPWHSNDAGQIQTLTDDEIQKLRKSVGIG
jgi:hypothetical protein